MDINKEYEKLNIDPATMTISSDNQVIFSYKDGSRDRVYASGSSYYGYIANTVKDGFIWNMRKAEGEKDQRLVNLANTIIKQTIAK